MPKIKRVKNVGETMEVILEDGTRGRGLQKEITTTTINIEIDEILEEIFKTHKHEKFLNREDYEHLNKIEAEIYTEISDYFSYL